MNHASSNTRRAARVGVAVVTVLAASAALVAWRTASAATLDLAASAATVDSTDRCTSTPVTVTPKTTAGQTEATIDGLTAADVTRCAGSPLTLRLVGTSGAVTTIAAGSVGTTATVAVPSTVEPSAVTAALVDVGGFAVDTEWKAASAPAVECEIWQGTTDTGLACTATAQISRVWGTGSTRYAELSFAVSPTLTYQQVAHLTFDLSTAFAESDFEASVAGWNWATSTVATNYPVDGGTISCSLPKFAAHTYAGASTGKIQINENKNTSPGQG